MSFRNKLWLTILISIILVTGATLYFTQNRIEASYRTFHRHQFQQHQDYLSTLQSIFLNRLQNVAGNLASSVRLIAALDVGDPQLIYENAFSELGSILPKGPRPPVESSGIPSHASFFRFLDKEGHLLKTRDPRAGPGDTVTREIIDKQLSRSLEKTEKELPSQDFGYMKIKGPENQMELYQVVISEIVDPYNQAVMGHLIIGFPFKSAYFGADSLLTGLWVDGTLISNKISNQLQKPVIQALDHQIGNSNEAGLRQISHPSISFQYLLFWEPINPESMFSTAYEVGLFSLESSNKQQRNLQYAVLGFGGITLAVALIFAVLISRNLTEPLNNLAVASRSIRKGEYDVDVPIPNEREFKQLALSFNQMADEIEKSQKKLIDARQYTDSILQSMINTMAVINPEGRIKRINRSLSEITGYEEDDLIGQSFERILGTDTSLAELNLPERIKNNRARNLEINYRDAEGNDIPMLFSASVLGDKTDQPEEFVCMAQDITERKEAQHRMMHDSLTNLPNRALFLDHLSEVLSQYYQDNINQFTVIYLDLDRFKLINDSLGLEIGDRLIERAVERMKSILDDEDFLSRLGDDDFALIYVDKPESRLIKEIETLIKKFGEPFNVNNRRLHTGLSAGIVYSEQHYQTPESILRDADTAMHHAQEQGGGRYEIFNPEHHEKIKERLELDGAIRRAIANDEFVPFFQPILTLQNETLHDFEALIRWFPPEGGQISPDTFIPLAEETDLIKDIGHTMRTRAINQLAEWDKQITNGMKPRLALNLSPRELETDEFTNSVRQLIDDIELEPGRVKFEITETSVMENYEMIFETLTELKQIGVCVSIDDFGTGYSSLSYLQQLPIDELKIDRRFIQKLGPKNNNENAIVKTIMDLADNLGLDVVAEGVESEEQLSFLLDINCDYIQGFYYARPAPADDAFNMIKQKTFSGTTTM